MKNRGDLLDSLISSCGASPVVRRPEEISSFIDSNKVSKTVKHELRQYAFCLGQLPYYSLNNKLSELKRAFDAGHFLLKFEELYSKDTNLRKMLYNVDSGNKLEIIIAILTEGIPVGGFSEAYDIFNFVGDIKTGISSKYLVASRLRFSLGRKYSRDERAVGTEEERIAWLSDILDYYFKYPIFILHRNSSQNCYKFYDFKSLNLETLKKHFQVCHSDENVVSKYPCIKLNYTKTNASHYFIRTNGKNLKVELTLSFLQLLEELGFVSTLTLPISNEEKKEFKKQYLTNYARSLFG